MILKLPAKRLAGGASFLALFTSGIVIIFNRKIKF